MASIAGYSFHLFFFEEFKTKQKSWGNPNKANKVLWTMNNMADVVHSVNHLSYHMVTKAEQPSWKFIPAGNFPYLR